MKLVALLESINESQIEAEFRQFDLPSFSLPRGTTLYHGTDRPSSEWDYESDPIFLPAWFGLDLGVAKQYAGFQRSGSSGPPVILTYRTTRDMDLLEASGQELSEFMDELYGNYTTDEIAESVCSLGFDGWHIKDTEVMLCSDDIELVNVEQA